MKFQFFKSKYFINLAAVTGLQQLMVAGSSYFLIRLSEDITQGKMNWYYLILFLACLTFVYIPVSLQKLFSELWTLDLQKNYIEDFIKSHKGRIEYLGDENTQNEKSGYLQREAFHVMDQVVFFWSDLLSTAMNVLFNIFIISSLLDKRFIFAYLLSALLFFAVNKLSNKYIANLSLDTQDKRVTFTGILNLLWNNLLIANKLHFNPLKSEIDQRFNQLQNSTTQNRVRHESVQILLTLLIMSPIVLFIVYLFYKHQSELSLLVPLAVSLHRQIQTVQHIEILGSLSLNAHALKGIISGLEDSLATLPENDIKSRINQQKIQIMTDNNRTLITGCNGAGKSSWLKSLKTENKEEALYIPANMDIYLGELTSAHSSGQKARHVIEALAQLPQSPKQTILLDEWDANLDQENTDYLEKLISEIAKSHSVFEVRHA